MPHKQKPNRQQTGLRREPLADLLKRAGVPADTWDICIVSDGSGSGWDNACGWAATLIDRATRTRKVFHGACTPGSVGLGELMGPLHALTWHHAKGRQGQRIVVLSDSQYVVNVGNKDRKVTAKANWYLWSMFDWLKRQGYRVKWYWLRRDEAALNKYADDLSRRARLKLTETDLAAAAEVLPTGQQISINRRNPF